MTAALAPLSAAAGGSVNGARFFRNITNRRLAA